MAVAYDNIIYNSVMDEIERVLLEVRDEIRAKMASEGVNASGRTSAGIQVQRYENGVRLVLTGDDVAPLATLETVHVALRKGVDAKVKHGQTELTIGDNLNDNKPKDDETGID